MKFPNMMLTRSKRAVSVAVSLLKFSDSLLKKLSQPSNFFRLRQFCVSYQVLERNLKFLVMKTLFDWSIV